MPRYDSRNTNCIFEISILLTSVVYLTARTQAWEERARADAAELRTVQEQVAQLEEKVKAGGGGGPDPAALAEIHSKHAAEIAAHAEKTKAAEAKATELEVRNRHLRFIQTKLTMSVG